MKIQSLRTQIYPSSQVREKREFESQDQDRSGHSQQDQNPQKERDEQTFSKELEESLKSFDSEQLTHSHRLQASIESSQNGDVRTADTSFGLKVVLRDSNGKVIHQLTGEEFIALRRNRKILDRKL